MTVTRCDRCQKEFNYMQRVRVKVSKFGCFDRNYELCEKCKQKLILFLTTTNDVAERNYEGGNE